MSDNRLNRTADPAGRPGEQSTRTDRQKDPEDPLADVPENELRSLAPSEGTGLTGAVGQPPPEQQPPSQPPPTAL